MKKIKAIVCDHMDLTWRRPFNKDFVFKGENFVSYAKLEEYYILDNIKLARENDNYKFVIESVEVVRNFLDRNPMYKDELKKLYEDGRVSTMFSGNNIIDINLCNGESIVRNYLYGKRWMKNILNHESKVCIRTDAFGNSAQLPQIIRKFDCDYIARICYSKCDGNYWRGLDGTTVVTTPFNIVFESGGYYKYPPCPKCKGYGCEECNYRGIDEDHVKNQIHYMDSMDLSKIKGEGPEYILCGGEELMPRDDILEFAREHKNEIDVEFSSYDELVRDTIDLSKVDNPPEEEVASTVEMNTNNTGVYATRIKIKQRFRKCENMMSAAEHLNAIRFLTDKTTHSEEIEKLWRKINFTMFHDALPATLVDPAYDELMEVFDKIENGIKQIDNDNIGALVKNEENTVTIFNPTGDTVEQVIQSENVLCDENGNVLPCVGEGNLFISGLKPFEARQFRKLEKKNIYESKIIEFARAKAGSANSILNDEIKETGEIIDSKRFSIENERFRITTGMHGIKEIFDKQLNTVVSAEAEYSPFEFVVEHDDGSPWATMTSDLRRTSLKDKTLLMSIEENENCKKMKFGIFLPDSIIAYSVTGIKVNYEVVLYKGSDRIYMNSDVFWDTENHRIRIAVPVPFDGKDMYEIPFGYLQREEYGLSRFVNGGWAAAMNDYPAINWVGVEGKETSVCLMNQGTPSHYITSNSLGGRTIFVTPLRSPGNATYLHDPAAYSMTDWDGMRDAGNHKFSYALTAYGKGFDKNNAVPDANAFNAKLYVLDGKMGNISLPVLECDGVRISAIKIDENGTALIIRAVEYHGKSIKGSMNLPKNINDAYETNLDEREIKKVKIENQKIELNFKPFEIKTLKFSF